ncbi:MAG: pyrroline-5-carboxylate reductase [candidate division KSB1 bacterium]|nr:pyrroline-5-carboxylate reductase [candidate division KSB1 bacterium]MDZ7275996.1 pyrroline-5-carboxylate reductase [candidate division KSB1 bacterium]MDZ7285722.1 pyrroline-5-carboxylate reductase [candidate division KSB1 bacterium]MDZ7298754.1 pyrroline-5-carboxylate reductase [candidate division KSB1 bacterium]MDZ7305937.1 pyrroline-5-carboxylate reductase [candidate division KSB1 bacterium]
MEATAKLAVLGAGKMGGTLIKALLDAGLYRRENIIATARHADRAEEIATRLSVPALTSNIEAVRQAQLVLLAVKPQALREVLAEIQPHLGAQQLVISIVASATTAFIEKYFSDNVPVVRAMPNTPSLIRAGMTVLSPGRHATPEHLALARRLFEAVGRTMILDEKHMDAVTALSASGPAFIYVVLESLAEGGVKVGLPRHVATELAAQMCLGAAQMVRDTAEHPALLKDAVTTPAGCTIDGLLKLEEGGLRVTLIKAVVEATRRAAELISC